MGNQSMIKHDTLEDEDFEIYSKNYRLNLTLLTNKFSKKQYILRKFPIKQTKYPIEEIIKVRKIIHHPYVTPLIQYRYDTTNKDINVLFEVPFRTFEEMRIERTYSQKYLSEYELLFIMHQVVQGLSHLKRFGISHQSIKSSNFAIDHKNSVKVIDPLVKTLLSNFERVRSSPSSYPKEIYLSPYEYQCVRRDKSPSPGQQFSSDMFSLGMTILQIGIMKTVQDVYCFTQGIRIVVLNNHLHELQSKCGSFIANIVRMLVDINPDARMSLEKVEMAIKIGMQKKPQNSNSINNNEQTPIKNKQKLQFKQPKNTTIVSKQESGLKPATYFSKNTTNNLMSETIKNTHKNKSPQQIKRNSPGLVRKKLLMEQTTTLSAAIKKKIDNLLEVSDSLKTYQYSSKSIQKLDKTIKKQYQSNKKTNHHNRRNTEQVTSIKIQTSVPPDFQRKNSQNPTFLLNFHDVALKQSINLDCCPRPLVKNTSRSSIFQSVWNDKQKQSQKPNQNNDSNANFSFAPKIQKNINNESTIEEAQKQYFRPSETSTKPPLQNIQFFNNPFEKRFHVSNLVPQHQAIVIPALKITSFQHTQSSKLLQQFKPILLDQDSQNYKLAKNRGTRHQSGDITSKTSINKQMQINLNQSNQTRIQKQMFESRFKGLQSTFHSKQYSSPWMTDRTHKLDQQQQNLQVHHKKTSLKNFGKLKQHFAPSFFDIKPINNYEGDVVRGLKHGKGKFIFDDGAIYQGQWSFNRMHGKGKLMYKSGRLAYDGQWFRDKMQGFGILNNENPIACRKVNLKNFNFFINNWQRYEGTFKNDKKHGNGILFFTSNQYYQGQFIQNLIHGQGTFFSNDGTSVQGRWQLGQLSKIY